MTLPSGEELWSTAALVVVTAIVLGALGYAVYLDEHENNTHAQIVRQEQIKCEKELGGFYVEMPDGITNLCLKRELVFPSASRR